MKYNLDLTPTPCPKCGVECKGKRSLGSHTRRCRAGEFPPCPECKSKSTGLDSKIEEKQRYRCINCGKKFFENSIVYTHCQVCGTKLENIRNQQKYCSQTCDSKAYYENHKEQVDEYRKKWKKKNYKKLKKKINARYQAYHYNRISKDTKCTLCGSKENLQRHHPDYKKPTWVIILCRACHLKLHNPNK